MFFNENDISEMLDLDCDEMSISSGSEFSDQIVEDT